MVSYWIYLHGVGIRRSGRVRMLKYLLTGEKDEKKRPILTTFRKRAAALVDGSIHLQSKAAIGLSVASIDHARRRTLFPLSHV